MRLLPLALLLVALPAQAAAPLTVAAASDLHAAGPALAKAFGAPVRFTFGSSGKLHAQIVNGAPFDAFFSADAAYPADLERQGLARGRFRYATGRLVLWTTTGIDVSVGLAALAGPQVAHVAIANPAHAPYGRAAEAAMRRVGVYDAVAPKLVRGENVAQAGQLVSSGAAEVGFVAMSLAAAPDAPKGAYWEVPPAMFPPLHQEAVVLKASKHPREADAFFTFVKSDAGRKILKAFGFR